MTNTPSLTRTLVDISMGRKPAGMVIRNGQWVCVQSGEIIPGMDIAIKDGHIAFVGADASHTIGKQTQVIEAEGRYLVPGLLDAHMHVESGMVTVTEFVRAVVPHGTTGMFIDPHEIANVFGLKGVKLMVDEAAQQSIHVWVQVPSCVPSAPGLETPGSTLGPADIAEAMTWPGIIGLGEMMNFPGVYTSDEKIHAEMHATRHAGKVIGGHYASPDLGLPFHGYVAGGPEDDHEGTRLEDAVARIRQGMKVMLRYGSAWHDVLEQVRAITELGLDSRHFLLCTDDSHAGTLASDGHMDRVIRHAVQGGIPPLLAIQMATINTAEHFGLSRQVGMIAPGRWADILLVDDLNDFHPQVVISRGHVVSHNGEWQVQIPAFHYPDWVKRSVHLPRKLEAKDFRLEFPASLNGKAIANVIGVIENQAPTRHLRMQVEPFQSEVKVDMKQDLAKIALVERHHGSGKIQVGLVHGFGFNVPCAVASTVAHDCHHLLVVGTDEANMAIAVNKLAEIGGGQVVVRNGEAIGLVDLSIAGLMSTEPVEVVAQKTTAVLEGFQACGCTLNNPNMQVSLLALSVIPELRISDKGLINVNCFEFLPVVQGITD